MRKIIVIALSALLLLSLALVSFGDSRETVVAYQLNSTAYQINIPASINLASTNRLPITLYEFHGGEITISITGSNGTPDAPFRMKGETYKGYLNYSVSDDFGTVYTPTNPIRLTSSDGISLILTPDTTNMNFVKNDNYVDYLTFNIG